MRWRLKLSADGSVLLPLIIVLPFLMLIATYYMDLNVSGFKLARQDQLHTGSQLAADAGADYALKQINLDGDWAGTGDEIELINTNDSRTTYEVFVAEPSPSEKTLTVTGRSFRPSSAPTPSTSVIIKVDLRPVESGSYSVVSGQGGLVMSNSSKITGGNVLINGEVTMSNSAQIGLSTNPVSVSVANQICPVPADLTYPRLCNEGENNNPININNTAHIWEAVPRIITYLNNYLKDTDHSLIIKNDNEYIYGERRLGFIFPDTFSNLSNGSIEIGAKTIIEPGVFIKGPAIIGQRCKISHGVYMNNVIIGNNCTVGHGSIIEDSVIMNHSNILISVLCRRY